MRRAAAGLLAAALCSALLAGCGLPLPDGVRSPGALPAEQALPQQIGVLPPDPQRGASPASLVAGFLTAQSSALDGHRIARGFLLPPARASWNDAAGVTVYDPATVAASTSFDPRRSEREPHQGDTAVVTYTINVDGAVAADGAARVSTAAPLEQTYRLRCDAAGQWRLVDVPPGLTLSAADRDRSFAFADVYFLAPPVTGAPSRHLVADRLLLATTGDRAQLVVGRVLAGPSSALVGSAQSAVPRATRLLSAVATSAAGEVTVNLSTEVGRLPGPQRRDLSAQLWWSLRQQVPTFTRLRLLVDGRPLDVPGQTASPRVAFSEYSPEGPRSDPPAYGLVDGEVTALDDRQQERRPSPLADVPGVVDAAVNPRLQTLAALSDQGGVRALRVGPLAGPLAAVLQDGALRSPSWGSGERGVFVLRVAPDPAVLLVAPDGMVSQVQVDGLPLLGSDPVLRVSRDGVRLALVADESLFVGRFESAVPVGSAGPLRVVELHPLAAGVLDVSWQTGTELVALVRDTQAPLLPVQRISIDGISVTSTGLVGVPQGSPVGIAAFQDQPLLIETLLAGSPKSYRAGTVGFVELPGPIRRPFYPG